MFTKSPHEAPKSSAKHFRLGYFWNKCGFRNPARKAGVCKNAYFRHVMVR